MDHGVKGPCPLPGSLAGLIRDFADRVYFSGGTVMGFPAVCTVTMLHSELTQCKFYCLMILWRETIEVKLYNGKL